MYFSLMDSRFGNGQSVGKRLLRLAVRGGGNQPIGIGRSMLRTLIWLVPLTLNGWALPLLRTPILAWFTGVILFGVGGAVLFTMVFNRRTRQGLHDMCAGTYVVRVDGEPIEALPIVARLQWIVAGVIVAVAAVLVTGGVFLGSVSGTPPQQVITLQGALERDHRFFSASVFDRTTYEIGGNTSRALRIEAWYKGVPSEDERKRAMSDVAKAALDQVDGVGQYDLMQISVTSAYDLGIATGRVTYNDTQPIDTWRERVGEPSAPHSGFPLPN
jgi:hypothetical protein